jgi:SulP family sulfate permease
VILDAGAIDRLDVTSAEMLKELIPALRAGGVDFALADVRLPVIEMAERSGLLELIGQDRIFHTIEQALQAIGNRGRG